MITSCGVFLSLVLGTDNRWRQSTDEHDGFADEVAQSRGTGGMVGVILGSHSQLIEKLSEK